MKNNYQMGKTGKIDIRVLSSAESFGYGPCSKLTCIAKGLTKKLNCKIDFLGEGAALNFALQNNFVFNSIREYDGVYPNPDNYDLVLSVMNPYTILWGWFHRKKCIYVDSLYWFWKFEKENFERLENIISNLTSAESIDAVWALIKDVSGHHLHYIAHRLSTISCNQFFNDEIYEEDIFRKQIKNTVSVIPIIDTTYKQKVDRDTILISLGGLLSPLNQKKEALAYVNLILRLTEEFISKASKHYRIILATNPEIVKSIKKIPHDISVVSFSQEEMLKTINRSILVLTPAGITTMYECLTYETPFFVLPELHDGHYPNYLRLAGKATKRIKELTALFPNSLISPIIDNRPNSDPDEEIRKIQSVIKSLNVADDSTFQMIKKNIDKMSQLVSKPLKLRKMAKQQRAFVIMKNVLQHKDVFHVIKKVINKNTPPEICKKHLVGIISSAIEVSNKNLCNDFKFFGTKLANNGINIATGAAVGITHLVGLGAKESGSRLIGFSPSANALEHSKHTDNADMNDFDRIHFNSNGFTARSLEFINSVDALIMISGRMGTLSEFTIAFEEGVPIFVLKGYGGISDKIEEIILHANKKSFMPPTITSNFNDLIDELMKMLNLRYYQ